PVRDDKAIASWNGLALAALAECGRVLERADWVEAAERLGEFLLGPLSAPEGRLHRTWRGGVAKGTGYLEDYADVANGLYELHVATGELRWLEESHRLARVAGALFADEELGGFFATPGDPEQLGAWDPRAVVAFGPSGEIPLLAGKGLVGGKPAVYVCERFACRAPVTDPAGFAPST